MKPSVWFHSDAQARCDGCTCGDREWQIDLPRPWYWVKRSGPPGLDMTDFQAVMTYAAQLNPDHPDVTNDFQETERFV